MNEADKTHELEELQRMEAIQEAARGVRHMPGPKECIKCKEPNDNMVVGLAVCSGCFEENEDG